MWSASYWVAQLPDLVDGDPALRQVQRHELDAMTGEGQSREQLRLLYNMLTWTYAMVAAPVAIVAGALVWVGAAPFLSSIAILAATFAGIEAVYCGVRWLTTIADSTIVVWRPLIAEIAMFVVTCVLVVPNV
jgi:hypothetical protein